MLSTFALLKRLKNAGIKSLPYNVPSNLITAQNLYLERAEVKRRWGALGAVSGFRFGNFGILCVPLKKSWLRPEYHIYCHLEQAFQRWSVLSVFASFIELGVLLFYRFVLWLIKQGILHLKRAYCGLPWLTEQGMLHLMEARLFCYMVYSTRNITFEACLFWYMF